jgi:hypothetical protein
MGDKWLDSMETAILQVPSVLSVVEFNLLINPRHPDAERIMTADPKPFAFVPACGNDSLSGLEIPPIPPRFTRPTILQCAPLSPIIEWCVTGAKYQDMKA